jgi:hypothetical protein
MVELSSVVLAQQKYINQIENENNVYKSNYDIVSNALQTLLNETISAYGIIINDLDKLVYEPTTGDIYPDINYINDEFEYYNIEIEGLTLFGSCCENKYMIIPKSFDPIDLNNLALLHKRLIVENRITNHQIGLLIKTCSCT